MRKVAFEKATSITRHPITVARSNGMKEVHESALFSLAGKKKKKRKSLEVLEFKNSNLHSIEHFQQDGHISSNAFNRERNMLSSHFSSAKNKTLVFFQLKKKSNPPFAETCIFISLIIVTKQIYFHIIYYI